MAKQSMNAFNKWVNSIPAKAEFQITMDADSTNEVWVDIDTGIDDNQAWAIYGVEYTFENIDPTVPLLFSGGGDSIHTLQIHRNDDSAILRNFDDRDVLFHDSWSNITGAAEHTIMVEGVRRVPIRQVTMQPTLRAIFRTTIDQALLSIATIQLNGRILYDTIPAPSGTASKLGQLTDL